MALRGDLMRDNVVIPDTCCPIAGFRSLKIFLFMAAWMKQRLQHSYKRTSLVESSQFYLLTGRIYSRTTLKFTYGSEYLYFSRNRCMETGWLILLGTKPKSEWLTSPEIGFQRLPTDGSIYVRRCDQGVTMVLNAVDDQFYLATNPYLKKWFEKAAL
jgi:hypothetical protein